MGCGQSKIENEETVARCRDRKLLMRDAVASRNAFAAAHASYTVSLKNTGAALSDYAEGEALDHRAAAGHHHHHHHAAGSSSSSGAGAGGASSISQPPAGSLPPPPPPLPEDFNPPLPLQRAASMPDRLIFKSKKIPTDPAISEEDGAEVDGEDVIGEDHASGAGPSASSATPEPPPPPPRLPTPEPPPPPPAPESRSTWDYFFSMDHNMPHASLAPPPSNDFHPERTHLENDGNLKRTAPPASSSSAAAPPVVDPPPATPEKEVVEPPPPPPPKAVKKPKQGGSAQPQNTNPVGGSESKRGKMVAGAAAARSVGILQVLNELDDHFLRSSECAHDVSKMLEATRMHYHSNFADNRGHIDHSQRLMRVITWNKSLKGIPSADDGKDDFDDEKLETHATILDKMLAWEKKLYDEVKAGELMKYDYQRKLNLLSKQKKRGSNPEAVERTKAAVSHLHTRYVVDMQSMDSTVSEINRLRDKQLYPKLVDLIDGMAIMWEKMHVHHVTQFKVIAELRGLDISYAAKETTEHHYDRTVQLWQIAREWHSQLQKLIAHQKEYVRALNGWLKLNLIPIESTLREKVSSPPRPQQPPIQPLLIAWHSELEKLPDELAKNAISGFAAIIKTIMDHQQDELKLKEKWQDTQKDFLRRKRAFEDWYHKFSQRRAGDPERPQDPSVLESGGGGGEGSNQNDPVAERKLALDNLEQKLGDEMEAHSQHCRQVREKSVASLKTHLPQLFRAMADFTFACSDMYKRLRSVTQPAEAID